MKNIYSLYSCDNIQRRFCNISYKFRRVFPKLIVIFTLLTLLGCGSEAVRNKSKSSDTDTEYHESVTLSWAAPTSDANGSILNDLAGYRIHYGTGSMNYTQSVDAGNFTTVVINSLSPGTWCFTVTAYDTSGNESNYSQELCTAL